jgi:hypothetical protein
MADILLVQMAAKKRAANAASDSADRTANYFVTNHSTADTACNRPHCTVATAAAMA